MTNAPSPCPAVPREMSHRNPNPVPLRLEQSNVAVVGDSSGCVPDGGIAVVKVLCHVRREHVRLQAAKCGCVCGGGVCVCACVCVCV